MTATVGVEVEANRRGTTGERGADVDEVAVAFGARAEHGIGEDDGVRFRPGDLAPEGGTLATLVGRAGPDRSTAHRFIGFHQTSRPFARLGVAAEMLGVQQVEGTHVEGGGDAYGCTTVAQAFGELETRIAVVEAAVDMG